ncbi:carbohydrate ABC transporter permease [Deinococcus ruber]|uniref:carbohydrate ABC transporter permease n=1 Tax=Deinococcus ruber TaxID=1848197 RepID=UPI001E390CEE|nr:carbohydrate ABC transporter permease [Deinococcus ruber]
MQRVPRPSRFWATVRRVPGALLTLIWLLVTALPFLIMVLLSLKSQADTYSTPAWAWPRTLDWSHYAAVLHGPFLGYLWNSVFVVAVSVALTLFLSSLAAFALARLPFRLNGLLFGLVVACLIVPVHVTLIPIYLMTRAAHLYDTAFALIGPYVAFSLPISIFILTEFMRQIPRELQEAAQIDGCGPFATYARIFFPLARPGLVTVGIYNGINLWNEFIFAYVLTSTPGHRTLPLAIFDFQGQYSSDIPAVLAVVTLTALPLIVVYIFGQERMVSGLMAGAIKG